MGSGRSVTSQDMGSRVVSLMDNEREQTDRTGRVVTGIWLRGPVALQIEQSMGTWQCRVNCAEGWRCSFFTCHRPRAFRQGNSLGGIGEAVA